MVSGTVILVISLLGILATAGLSTWLITIIFKREDIPIDDNFGLIVRKEVNGRAYGNVKEIIPTTSNKFKVFLDPKDVSHKTFDKSEVNQVRMICEKDKILRFPKGSWSKDKNIDLFLPGHVDDFPDGWKNTPIGKLFQFYVEITNADNTELDALREGFERQKAHISSMGMGEVSVERMDRMEGLFKDIIEMMRETKRDKNPSLQPLTPQ